MGTALRRVLVSGWRQRGWLAWFLLPASLLYSALVRLRKYLYLAGILQVKRVPVPVIVVGNVVAGGGGKTPVVMALLAHFQTLGLKPGVVSRGYGRSAQGCREVSGTSLARDVGDEPILIKQTSGVPVFVARARIDAARALLARYPDVDLLVCDDGLQHYGLHRDLEICVFDEGGIGNGLMLPSGPLREPWPRPASLVLSAGKRLGRAGFTLQRTLADHAVRGDGSRLAMDGLRGFINHPEAQLWAVAGIARPEAFFSMLRERGLPLARTMALADHADYDGARWLLDHQHTLVCTEKDATKLWQHRPDALAVPLLIDIEAAFWTALDGLLEQARPKLSSGHGHTPS